MSDELNFEEMLELMEDSDDPGELTIDEARSSHMETSSSSTSDMRSSVDDRKVAESHEFGSADESDDDLLDRLADTHPGLKHTATVEAGHSDSVNNDSDDDKDNVSRGNGDGKEKKTNFSTSNREDSERQPLRPASGHLSNGSAGGPSAGGVTNEDDLREKLRQMEAQMEEMKKLLATRAGKPSSESGAGLSSSSAPTTTSSRVDSEMGGQSKALPVASKQKKEKTKEKKNEKKKKQTTNEKEKKQDSKDGRNSDHTLKKDRERAVQLKNDKECGDRLKEGKKSDLRSCPGDSSLSHDKIVKDRPHISGKGAKTERRTDKVKSTNQKRTDKVSSTNQDQGVQRGSKVTKESSKVAAKKRIRDQGSQSAAPPEKSEARKGKADPRKLVDVGLPFVSNKPNEETTSSGSKTTDVQELSRTLFGDSDSDSENEYKTKADLTESGKRISRIMTGGGESQRPRFSNDKRDSSQKDGVRSQSDRGSKSGSRPQEAWSRKREADKDDADEGDPVAGIRIRNPKLSSAELKRLSADRICVRLPELHLKDLSALSSWITFGVICKRSNTMKTIKGCAYMSFTLSDMKDLGREVTLLLFSKSYEAHKNIAVGSVVGLSAPRPMASDDKRSKKVCLTLDSPEQLLLLGHSKDLGTCRGRAKQTGALCNNYINRSFGDMCVFHASVAYKKMCATRPELNLSYSGNAPKSLNPVNSFRNKILKKSTECVIYGGQTFTNQSITKSSDKVTLNSLRVKQAQLNGKPSALTLGDIQPATAEQISIAKSEKREALENIIASNATTGSMQFIAHLRKKEMEEENDPKKAGDPPKPMLKSISHRDLLKQQAARVNGLTGLRPKQSSASGRGEPLLGRGLGASGADRPQIGKGLSRGMFEIGGAGSNGAKASPITAAEFAKMRAINKVQQTGGLGKENPNRVKGKGPEGVKVTTKKRAHDNNNSNPSESSSSSGTQSKKKKKSKIVDGVDIYSEEFLRVKNATSSHVDTVDEITRDRQARYFDHLERKEGYEQQMTSVQSIKAPRFSCAQCDYSAWKLSDLCKQQKHEVKRWEATKRFFKCNNCGTRCTTHNRIPEVPCKNCGQSFYSKTGMMAERKGPKTDAEKLTLRGNEEKYVGSIAPGEDVNFN